MELIIIETETSKIAMPKRNVAEMREDTEKKTLYVIFKRLEDYRQSNIFNSVRKVFCDAFSVDEVMFKVGSRVYNWHSVYYVRESYEGGVYIVTPNGSHEDKEGKIGLRGIVPLGELK